MSMKKFTNRIELRVLIGTLVVFGYSTGLFAEIPTNKNVKSIKDVY